jgi:hypothetical protein
MWCVGIGILCFFSYINVSCQHKKASWDQDACVAWGLGRRPWNKTVGLQVSQYDFIGYKIRVSCLQSSCLLCKVNHY